MRNFWLRPNGAALAIAVACALAAGWLVLGPSPDLFNPTALKPTLQQMGHWGPVTYIAVLALSVVVSPVPGAPLAVAAGMVWGMPMAGVYSVIGGFLGSLMAYFLGRTLGSAVIRSLTGKSISVDAHRGERYLGWLIFFSRLFPVLPFDGVSYGAGMLKLSVKVYAVATLLGMIPSTFLLSYAGQTLTTTMPQRVAMFCLLLIVFVGLPWVAHRYNWFGFRDIIRIE
ncbi:TVP38/TMEM64 family protein [Nodosilinea sp. FACHB-131]|uniref:TVP38/TMEM64 family protein n=1 Tax=Cyanophyceae TaxID=3028117 RepID=UPI001683FF5B|nr:TVP38/TMEM64 family protein [Nodosilinea sp. FACHB-131]MBD1872087.1 TVP38/TMEM64 family protein [Nodosilinea sp. FACHB-131]